MAFIAEKWVEMKSKEKRKATLKINLRKDFIDKFTRYCLSVNYTARSAVLFEKLFILMLVPAFAKPLVVVFNAQAGIHKIFVCHKNFMELRGFEPLTPSLRTRCSPS